MKKNQARKKDGADFEAREIREDFSEEVTLELRPALSERSESTSHAKAWGMLRALGRENGKCKGPEVWLKKT